MLNSSIATESQHGWCLGDHLGCRTMSDGQPRPNPRCVKSLEAGCQLPNGTLLGVDPTSRVQRSCKDDAKECSYIDSRSNGMQGGTRDGPLTLGFDGGTAQVILS